MLLQMELFSLKIWLSIDRVEKYNCVWSVDFLLYILTKFINDNNFGGVIRVLYIQYHMQADFIPIWMTFVFLSCQLVLAGISRIMLNKRENWHSFLVSNLRGIVVTFSPLSLMMPMCLSGMIFLIVRFIVSIPSMIDWLMVDWDRVSKCSHDWLVWSLLCISNCPQTHKAPASLDVPFESIKMILFVIYSSFF